MISTPARFFAFSGSQETAERIEEEHKRVLAAETASETGEATVEEDVTLSPDEQDEKDICRFNSWRVVHFLTKKWECFIFIFKVTIMDTASPTPTTSAGACRRNLDRHFFTIIFLLLLPVVPRKAVAEVSKIGNL